MKEAMLTLSKTHFPRKSAAGTRLSLVRDRWDAYSLCQSLQRDQVSETALQGAMKRIMLKNQWWIIKTYQTAGFLSL